MAKGMEETREMSRGSRKRSGLGVEERQAPIVQLNVATSDVILHIEAELNVVETRTIGGVEEVREVGLGILVRSEEPEQETAGWGSEASIIDREAQSELGDQARGAILNVSGVQQLQNAVPTSNQRSGCGVIYSQVHVEII